MFTIGLALLVAKYGEKHFGSKAAASWVGAVAGAVVDVTIIHEILLPRFIGC